MASHNELGRIGESLGKTFLELQGFQILHVNWKYSYFEIDIIATKNNTLHFIEVKTRRSLQFGLPEESVDEKKFEKIETAAEAFMYLFPAWTIVQYDILAVSFRAGGEPEFFLLEDVYM